jgi:hypothetical protein
MTDPGFKPATRESQDYADAIEVVSKQHVAVGFKTDVKDPISALLGVLGSFIAGAPEFVRPDMIDKCDKLLRISVEQSLKLGTSQRVVAETRHTKVN